MYKQIASNKRRSILLMGGFILVYGGLGWLFSLQFGPAALIVAGAIALVMILVNLFGGDDLAVLVAGGRQVHRKEDSPELWRKIENLSITAGLPMPRVYISPDPAPNAFAAGRTPRQAIVCVTTGLLERLDEQELEGVLAHELSHIRNYDVRLMTFAAVLAGSIALLAQLMLRGLLFGGGRSREGGGNPLVLIAVIAGAILAPIAALLIQMAISRRREYVADAAAVELTRYPQGLASALEAISGAHEPSRFNNNAIAHMMIAAPLNARGRASTLFATHPPIEDRVARLTEMAAGELHARRASAAPRTP